MGWFLFTHEHLRKTDSCSRGFEVSRECENRDFEFFVTVCAKFYEIFIFVKTLKNHQIKHQNSRMFHKITPRKIYATGLFGKTGKFED